MFQLSTDHDYARLLALEVVKGSISPEEAANHPQRQALTSYLGQPNLEEIDRNQDPIILQPGDRILLCSDGLYKTLSEAEIAQIIDQEPQDAAEDLIDSTLAKGKTNQDNVTVAILACESELQPDILPQPPEQPDPPPPEPPTLLLPRPAFNTISRKIIVVVILLVSMVGAAYFARYLPGPRNHAKAAIPDLETPKAADLPGPPLMEHEKQLRAPAATDTKKEITRRSQKEALQKPITKPKATKKAKEK